MPVFDLKNYYSGQIFTQHTVNQKAPDYVYLALLTEI
jgi:hypothetical protein